MKLTCFSRWEAPVWKETTVGLILTLIASGMMGGCAVPQSQVSSGHSSADSGRPSASFDYNRHIGWVHGRCLAIKRTDLSTGMVVQVITLSSPQHAVKTSVTGMATHDSGCLALLPERAKINQKKGRSFYMLDLQGEANLMAVGLVDFGAELFDVNGTLRMDIDHDGNLETAVSCQSSEGIKFYLMPVDRSDTTPVWLDYYYLGYDTKPTCRD
jgi:hypothetical protein